LCNYPQISTVKEIGAGLTGEEEAVTTAGKAKAARREATNTTTTIDINLGVMTTEISSTIPIRHVIHKPFNELRSWKVGQPFSGCASNMRRLVSCNCPTCQRFYCNSLIQILLACHSSEYTVESLIKSMSTVQLGPSFSVINELSRNSIRRRHLPETPCGS
jgi:hypothetical protein